MTEELYSGILRRDGQRAWIADEAGDIILEPTVIWQGYLKHWTNQNVHARFLPQRDYENREPILIMWPREPVPDNAFVEFYFNERLVKYPASFFGHNAINVNGHIYNFSHLINENEIMAPEEYFYRPALGEFAPSPDTGKFEIKDDGRAYFDKFGRNFMRTIHVLRIYGMDTEQLSAILNHELEIIHATPPHPARPEKYPDFSFFNRSCSTIIRDAFRRLGYTQIAGVLPRDLFVNTAFHLRRESALDTRFFLRPQLMVEEAPPSALAPLMNPRNRIRFRSLKVNI
ncbi:MAG: hypothetical protein ACE5D8_04255 [Fidelibacterota bacterium]